MRKKWLRVAAGTVILIGAVAAIAGGVGGATTREIVGPRILPVTTVVAQRVTSYRTRRTYTGTVVAARAADLSFERSGELTAINVDQGDRVEAGDSLATLNTTGLQARRRELVAQRAAAQALLDELTAGARPETLAAAQAEVSNLESQFKLQQLTLVRREKLIRERAVSQAEYDQATFGLQSAEASLEAARQKLAELAAGPREEKKVAQRAVVEQLDAAIAVVDADLEESCLVAPFRGTITRRVLDEGSVAAAGQEVVRLVEDSQLEAWFGLPVSAARHLQLKTRCTVRVDDRERVAVIKAVVPELDTSTRTRRVVLSLQPNSAAPVFAGEIARLDLETDIPTGASFWLPTTALVRSARGLWCCYAVVPAAAPNAQPSAPSCIEKRDVKIVHTAGERVLVRGMLQLGDAIVAAGAHRMVPGQAVRDTSAE